MLATQGGKERRRSTRGICVYMCLYEDCKERREGECYLSLISQSASIRIDDTLELGEGEGKAAFARQKHAETPSCSQ